VTTTTTRVGTGMLSSGSDIAVLLLIVVAGTVSVGTWLVGQVAGLLFTLTWPHASIGDTANIVVSLPHHWSDPRAAWPAAAQKDLPGPIGFYLAAVVVLAAIVAVAVVVYRRWGLVRRGRGLASRHQLGKALTASAVLRKGHRLRPNLGRTVTVADVALELGTAGTVALYASIESSVLLLAAPRQGKTSQVIIPWLRSFPGPALVTSVRHDVLETTATLRSGTAWVMNLTGQLRWPHRLRWSPVAGCEQFDVARRRADVMIQVGKQASADATNAAFFGMSATNLMAAWLHTAALTGRTMGDVLTWSTDETNDEPVKLLRDATGARPGVLRMLDSFYRQPHTTRANLWTTVQTGTAVLFGEAAHDVFCGSATHSFDIHAFLRSEADTLYLLVDENQVSAMAPLVTTFVQELLITATRRASAEPTGRADPPLGLILDEVTNVVPLPDLPKTMSTAAGFGIFITAVMQNLAAAEERWGPVGRKMIWSNSTIKIALGGLAGDDLDEFSRLAGTYRENLIVSQRDQYHRTQASVVDRKTMAPEDIRILGEDRRQALIIHATTPAVMTRMVRHYESRHANDYERAVGEARALMGYQGQAGA
jgi:type IV secretion system protein VirD4